MKTNNPYSFDDRKAEVTQNLVKSYANAEEVILSNESIDELEKGGKKAFIGEKRMFGGREYVRTKDGWKYHGKGTGAKAQEHVAGATIDHTQQAKIWADELHTSTQLSAGMTMSQIDEKQAYHERQARKQEDKKTVKVEENFDANQHYRQALSEFKQAIDEAGSDSHDIESAYEEVFDKFNTKYPQYKKAFQKQFEDDDYEQRVQLGIATDPSMGGVVDIKTAATPKVGDVVKLNSDVNLISLSNLKGQSLKVVGSTETGLISQPTFLKVKDESGEVHEINPQYVNVALNKKDKDLKAEKSVDRENLEFLKKKRDAAFERFQQMNNKGYASRNSDSFRRSLIKKAAKDLDKANQAIEKIQYGQKQAVSILKSLKISASKKHTTSIRGYANQTKGYEIDNNYSTSYIALHGMGSIDIDRVKQAFQNNSIAASISDRGIQLKKIID